MRILHQYGKRYVDIEELDDYLLDKQIQYEQANVNSKEATFIRLFRLELKGLGEERSD